MNSKIAAITLTGLLAACPLLASAATKTADESAAPPTALPGVNQAGKAQSNADKAMKRQKMLPLQATRKTSVNRRNLDQGSTEVVAAHP
jgi:hypothetical protein